jgi:uncharacterized protein (TIGR02145 family)
MKKTLSSLAVAMFMMVIFTGLTRAQDNSQSPLNINTTGNAPASATCAIANYTASPGENLTIPVTVANWTNIGAITIYIRYNPSVLTFNGINSAPIGMLGNATDSTIILGWYGLSYLTLTGTLCNLTFTYNGPGSSVLNFLPNCEVVSMPGFIPVQVTYTNGSVTAKTDNPAHGSIIDVNGAIPGNTIAVPVQYTGFPSNVGNMIQKIHFDQSQLTFNSLSSAGNLTGATATASNGLITINWANSSGTDINYPGSDLTLNFTYNGTNVTPIEYYPGCLIKTNTNANIAVSYFNGTITPGVLPPTPCPGVPTVSYGGKTYNTILIGTQCWLRENLDIGTRISGSQNQANDGTIQKYCYANLDANCAIYGGLYQWDEMMQYVSIQGVQGICPTGWHLPTDDDYSVLTSFLGGETIAGGKIKETGTSHWTSPNTGATNTSWFTALPGGFNNSTGGFSHLSDYAYFWSSTEHASLNAWRRSAVYNTAEVNRTTNTKESAFSVRCLKDECSSYTTVSVSISTGTATVCSGTQVTFTATPVNGGTSPFHQWKVNGTNAGTNSSSYSYVPSNGDQVTCVMTSSQPAPCFIGNPATSNTITMTVNPLQPVSVTIGASANPVCTGTQVTFTATPVNGGSAPAYQWKVNGSNAGSNNAQFSYIPADNDVVTCVLTSNISCPSGNPATSNAITMTVNQPLPVSVIVTPSENPVCTGDLVTFTATPTNGGNTPVYQWFVNGSPAGTNNSLYSYVPSHNDQVYCILTSSETCVSGNPATSNVITISVIAPQPVQVSIVPSENPVCEGTTVFYLATPVNGGSNPTYQWKVNGINSGTNSPVFSYTPVNNDVVTCVLTSSLSCVTGNPATSNAITMTVNPGLPVSVSIGVAQNPVCAGTMVTFTATPVNEGNSPFYQWKVNGTNAGTNNPSFVYTPSNNDIITCVMTSNLPCTSNNPATSNAITMSVNALQPVSVSITSSASMVCPGTTVTFTATPINGGTLPAYQWKVNGANQFTGSPVYAYIPADGDQITCVLTSNVTCPSGNPATSNTIVMSVPTSLPVSVTIVASANPVCAGTMVGLTAFPINGGASPTYQWKVNGNNAGSNSPYFSYIPTDNDVVTCILTSDLTCSSGNPATSNAITMTVTQVLPVSVSIAASATNVCAGTQVTFTATPVNGGSAPFYQWQVNGSNAGTNNPVLTYTPQNNDVVTCILTSSLSCATGNPATSNAVTMAVNPQLPVSIMITASANQVCTGTAVTFTAYPVNGGTAPVYQWKLNGVNVGTNHYQYSYTPLNNDIVTCDLTSNAACPTGNPATSNSISMEVYPFLPVNVSISASANPVCEGSTVTMTATPVNGGTNPTYQWFVNGTPAGSNNPVFTYAPASNDQVLCVLTSGLPCTTGNPAISNVVTLQTNPVPAPLIDGPSTVVAGSTGNIYSTQPGMTGYDWTVSAGGIITDGAGTNTVTVTWNIPGTQQITVNYANSYGCPAPSPTIKEVSVQNLPAPTITGPDQVCEGTQDVVYYTETGMTNYTWLVSAGGTITFGGGPNDNIILVTWHTSGPQWVSVNYQNAGGIPAPVPTVLDVTVHPLPQPVITGNVHPCVHSSGNTYTATSGMIIYQWVVSAGGSVTAGGGLYDDFVTVTWNTAGPQQVSVSSTNSHGCVSLVPYDLPVTVEPLPVPTITGPETACYGAADLIYYTEQGMNGYQWNVSAGGVITSGAGTSIITVTWTGAGNQNVGVTYVNAYNCSPAIVPTLAVLVYEPFAAGTVSATQSICHNSVPQPLQGTASTGGQTPYQYQWQQSTDGSLFTDIPGANTLDYVPGTLTQTTLYRLKQSSAGGCGEDYTNTVTIQVAEPFVAGTIQMDQTVDYNTIPVPLTGTPPSGGQQPYSYQWQNSEDGSNFTDIPGATGLNYAPPALLLTTYYRQTQFSSGNCGTLNTNIVTITVNPQPVIAITSPNGGESWYRGTSHDITWTNNISGDVKIELFKGGIFDHQIVASTPANGSYSWTIPTDQTTGQDYKVKVTSLVNPAVSDLSDNDFTILASNVPENLVVQNVEITNGQTICYDALNQITVAGDGTTFVIQNGGSATMIAGQRIVYLPGTTVMPGGYLHGYITTTGQYCGMQAPSVPSVAGAGEPTETSEIEFRVFPNPTKGLVNIEVVQSTPDGNARIELFSLLGEKISSAPLTFDRKNSISLEGQPAGIYFLRILSGDQFRTVKIIKNQ